MRLPKLKPHSQIESNEGEIYHFRPKTQKIVGIGASTGGTTALEEILSTLPSEIPPILIVQHFPSGFAHRFAERLKEACPFEIAVAEQGDLIHPGKIYIAPSEQHMKIRKGANGNLRIHLSDRPAIGGHKPSVNYLFHSMAELCRHLAVGIILTGMGQDGAEGLLEIRKSGGHTIAQGKSSCIVFGMPKAAIKIHAARDILSLDKISQKIINLVSRKLSA